MRKFCSVSLVLLAMGTLWTAPARGADPGVEELVAMLRAKGVIDEAEGTKILARSATKDSKAPEFGSLAGVEFFGDFRARYESFSFDTDSSGSESDDRNRFRYRLRFGAKKKIGERLAVGFRLASNLNDPRSTNTTLGDMVDFAPDPVTLDRAFVEYALPDGGIEGLKSKLSFGKTDNPFRWSQGPDFLIWDGDITLEGASLQGNLPLSETAWLFGNTGFYVIQERATNADPKVLGLQLGGGMKPSDTLELGLRASGYDYRSLDATFIARAKSSALAGGNTDGAFDSRARIAELATYLRWSGWQSWPVLVWANAARNLTADSTSFVAASGGIVRVGDERDAFATGIEIGDAKKLVRLSASFFQIEPNAVVSLFTESDVFDGRTNVRGFLFSASRFLLPNLELRIALSDTDSLRNRGRAAGPFASALTNRDRKRIQTDLLLSF